MEQATKPELRQWRDGRWFFNYISGHPSPLWKSREFAQRKLDEYADTFLRRYNER